MNCSPLFLVVLQYFTGKLAPNSLHQVADRQHKFYFGEI